MRRSSKARPGLRWVGVAVLVAVSAVVFFAVKGGGNGGRSSNAIVEAAEATEHEPGGHLAFHSRVSSSSAAHPTVWTGAMVFDSTDASKGIVRTSRFDGGASAVEDVIADGDSFYSRPNESALQKEAEWLGFGYAVGEEMDEVDFVGADVGPELEALGEATDVVAAGTAKVRGVETTRYRGNAPGLGHVEVWIDGDDRVRRLRVAGSKVEEGGREAMTNMSVDFFDFGAVPEIKPPARDQVLNVREFEIANLERQGE